MAFQYIARLAEKTLEDKLNSCGCVLVSGPKFCGKTTLCNRFAKSSVSLKRENDIILANSDPASMLRGEHPHLIDEWQKAPSIWNEIKADLDDDYQFGKYIITGSTTPVDPSKIQHSGAGRIVSMPLRTLSLFESGESTGEISLSALFQAEPFSKDRVFSLTSKVGLPDIAFYLCRGGWPVSLTVKPEYALLATQNYYDGLFTKENENDDFAFFLKNKDIELLNLILRNLARNVSTQRKRTSMIKDILESGIRASLDDETFSSYEKVLKDLFIVYDMPAWNLNLRSSVNVRSSPTHHFVDTSIATSCLGIKPSDLLNDIRSFGLFFEDMAVRDLSIYLDSFGGSLKHYRDSNGQEVDAVALLPNGTYGAIEIKLANEINIAQGIASLNRFENKMRNSGLNVPKFKMVLTTHGACYYKEGVYVVPITSLRN